MKRAIFRPDITDGAMLAVVLMWAANNILIKIAVNEVAPLPFVVARFLIVIVLVWVWIAWRRIPTRITIREIPLLILAGVSGFGAYTALFTVGMKRTSAFSAALLISLSPIFTLLLARLLRIERPLITQWLAAGLAATGVLVFVGDKVQAEGFDSAISGDLLSLVAAFSFSVYSLAARPLVSRYGSIPTTAWAAVVGLVVIAPWGVPEALREPWLDLSLPVWGSLFYAAAVSMLIGYTIWSWSISRVGVARTVPYLFLVPIATGIISAITLGEIFTPLRIVGAAMVLGGTALVRVLGRGMTILPQPLEAPPGAARITVARAGN